MKGGLRRHERGELAGQPLSEINRHNRANWKSGGGETCRSYATCHMPHAIRMNLSLPSDVILLKGCFLPSLLPLLTLLQLALLQFLLLLYAVATTAVALCSCHYCCS